MADEKRIYVVVAETVDTPSGVVNQSCGRMAAQCAHVVSKMQVHRITSLDSQKGRVRLALEAIASLVQILTSLKLKSPHKLKPCTTIVLAVRDSRELNHIEALLAKFGHEHFTFVDSNPGVYGDGVEISTAVCTLPVYAIDMTLILGYLHCWEHGIPESDTETVERPQSFWDLQEQPILEPSEGQRA
jgi:peptidyl-tRNA hydrolase